MFNAYQDKCLFSIIHKVFIFSPVNQERKCNSCCEEASAALTNKMLDFDGGK